jgi:Cu-Zn family superoxide dismutase
MAFAQMPAAMPPAPPPVSKAAPLSGSGGATIGRVTLTDAPQGVLLRVEASGLTPGWHAVHFHDKADCSDAAFKSAGSHVHMANPSVHGLLNPAANDLGDLPNIHAGADGSASAEFFSSSVALRAGATRANLLDADGSAVVIHAAPDDHLSQPIGGAGSRVACAAIK